MKDVKEPEIKFEKALADLRQIVEKLEKGDLELDESLKLFERGVGLIQTCSKRLEDADRRVQVALKAKDGKRKIEDFPEGESDADDDSDGGT